MNVRYEGRESARLATAGGCLAVGSYSHDIHKKFECSIYYAKPCTINKSLAALCAESPTLCQHSVIGIIPIFMLLIERQKKQVKIYWYIELMVRFYIQTSYSKQTPHQPHQLLPYWHHQRPQLDHGASLRGTGTIVAVVGRGALLPFTVGRIFDDVFRWDIAWKQLHPLEDELIDPTSVFVSGARPIVWGGAFLTYLRRNLPANSKWTIRHGINWN